MAINFLTPLSMVLAIRKGEKTSSLSLRALRIVGPWLLMGEFNCIANINERIGQRPHNSELNPLRRCMETCEIHDLKSTGRFFTWTNKQEVPARVLSKIDRVMGNHSWETTFPTVEAAFLPEGDFDHTPMLFHFFKQHRRTCSFKFFNHWGKREEFLGVIQDIWNTPIQGLKSHQIIQKLNLIQAMCNLKFKKDKQTAVILAENNLLKAQ